MTNTATDVVLANWAAETLLKEASQCLQTRDHMRVEQICRDALAAEPAASDAWHLLAIALAEQHRFKDAAQAIQRATQLLPSSAAYWVTRGIIAADQNLLSEAQASFQHALTLKPKLSEAHYFLGQTFHRAGELPQAIAAYRKAVRGLPERPEIHFQLGRALVGIERPQEALAAFEAAFLRDPEGKLDRRECLECFRRRSTKPLPDFWYAELARFFDRQDIDKSRYAWAGLHVLAMRPAFRSLLGAEKEWSELQQDAVAQIMGDPLFGTLLRDALICHPQFELMLTRLRRKLLQNEALRRAAPPRFLCDLALQCLNNEFVYAESEIETAKLADLWADIEQRLAGAQDEGFIRLLAVFAMYRPLHRQAGIKALLSNIPEAGTAKELLRRAVGDPLRERELQTSIPSIGRIADPLSQRVRAQYEENPYPRWINFDRSPRLSAADWVKAELPRVPVEASAIANILIAGCGTGLEAISLAAKITDARITAVDLSLASLAYAKRKADEFRTPNVEFAQADILELDGLGPFDVVLSVGVLHHLRDPREGLKALLRLVRPGGLMKIGLYSERARRDINVAREMIRKRQLPATHSVIRAFRQEIVTHPNSPLAALLRWRDFFTMSECRDLLFHVQEHQFTPIGIAELFKSEGIAVLGLSKHLSLKAVHTYRQLAPDDAAMVDLVTWDTVEAQLPDIFADMCVMWCRTPLA